MTDYTARDGRSGWMEVPQAESARTDLNSGQVTPACYRAEKFINDSTLGEVAESMDLLLTRIDLFEQQLARNGSASA